MKSLDRHIALLNHDSWEIDKKIQEKNYEIEQLEKRINKAIEYIEQHNYPQLDEMDYYSTSDLLDILKGVDKE